MYNPDVFRQDDISLLWRWIRDNPFGVLVTNTASGIEATHLPFVATEPDSEGRWKLIGHMAAANSQWRSFSDQVEALVIFQGPHAYVSPTLYPAGAGQAPVWHYSGIGAAARHAEPALPTWNYVAVHVRGNPILLDDKRAVLARQVAAHEKDWNLDMLPSAFVQAKQARIVAFEIPVRAIEGKAKLGQRQSAEERFRVAEQLNQSVESSARKIAQMMKKHR